MGLTCGTELKILPNSTKDFAAVTKSGDESLTCGSTSGYVTRTYLHASPLRCARTVCERIPYIQYKFVKMADDRIVAIGAFMYVF